MHVKPISALTSAEIHDLAVHAAERGERVEDVNPFPQGSRQNLDFARAFNQRAAELVSTV
ncbi:MAG: hypothetical protein EOO27_09235 [Comamonadaceae bacterium]|nr:MAG: hypothetical protein EOO27_09235 [Comamonadaceae bacterium]